ncbi:MAG: RecX family transcriptional regulator [Anaerolineales bacterium]|nr:RecX family transcriptional regulator [Anaerolineales bacterium]
MEHQVTALKVDPKRRGRIQVHLDGALAMTLSASAAAGLTVGQQLRPEAIEQLTRLDAERAATAQALRLISRRPRSEQELRQAWDRRAVALEAQAAALEHLRRTGQVDDAAFAATWIENRGAFRPRSVRALKSELRRKGVDDSAIATAVEGIDETEAAYRAAQRFAQRSAGLPEQEFYRRLGGQLARRGFTWEIIRAAVRRVWAEQSPNP